MVNITTIYIAKVLIEELDCKFLEVKNRLDLARLESERTDIHSRGSSCLLV